MCLASVQASSASGFFQLVSVLLIFLFVIGITYVATHWIVRYQKGLNPGHNLNLIETLRITQNKYIQIVQAGDVYLVIAVGKDEVRLLAKLTAEQLKELPDEGGSKSGVYSFQELLEKLKKRMPKK